MIEVVHADALVWMRKTRPEAYAVLLTDPPYGINAMTRAVPRGAFNGTGIVGDGDTAVRDAVLEWRGVDVRPAAVFGARSRPHFGSPRGVLTWDKLGAAGMGDVRFPWKPDNTEEIAVYGPGWSGSRDSSVLHYCPVRGGDGKTHPHEKPVALLMHVLSKAPRGRVLDLFGGSGAVAEAAARMGRDCTIVEIDDRWIGGLTARAAALNNQLSLW